jgi:hypothetical protein
MKSSIPESHHAWKIAKPVFALSIILLATLLFVWKPTERSGSQETPPGQPSPSATLRTKASTRPLQPRTADHPRADDPADMPAAPAPGSTSEVLTPQAAARLQKEADPAEHGGLFIAQDHPAAMSHGPNIVATISVGAKKASVRGNQAGKFPIAYISPSATAEVSLYVPELTPGDSISLAASAGGSIDGEPSARLAVDPSKRVAFRFTAGDALGAYPVRIRTGNDFKTLVFWVGPRAYGDASAVKSQASNNR